jgi:hypothetical protein
MSNQSISELADDVLKEVDLDHPKSTELVAAEGGHYAVRLTSLPVSSNIPNDALVFMLCENAGEIPLLPNEVARAEADEGCSWIVLDRSFSSAELPSRLVIRKLSVAEPPTVTETRTLRLAKEIYRSVIERGASALITFIIGDLFIPRQVRHLKAWSLLPKEFRVTLADVPEKDVALLFESECQNRGDQVVLRKVQKWTRSSGACESAYREYGFGFVHERNDSLSDYFLFGDKLHGRRMADPLICLTRDGRPSCAVTRAGLHFKLASAAISRHLSIHDFRDDPNIRTKVADGAAVAACFSANSKLVVDIVSLRSGELPEYDRVCFSDYRKPGILASSEERWKQSYAASEFTSLMAPALDESRCCPPKATTAADEPTQ